MATPLQRLAPSIHTPWVHAEWCPGASGVEAPVVASVDEAQAQIHDALALLKANKDYLVSHYCFALWSEHLRHDGKINKWLNTYGD